MKKILIIIISCLLCVAGCLIGGYFFIESEIQKPFRSVAEEETFEVKEGQRTREIAENLEKEGFIKKDLYFLFYALKNPKARNLETGKYCLSSSQNIPEIIDRMTKGGAVKEEIKITFPEGWRILDIEDELKSAGLIEKDEILEFKIDSFKESYDFLSDVQDGESLEGFLFPDTYFFRCPEPEIVCEDGRGKIKKCQSVVSGEEIVQKLLSNFDTKLTSDLREEIKKQKKTIFEIIIMASILEKEVQILEDKKIASGIFWKKVKENQRLNSCATIAYILKSDHWTFSEMREEIAKGKEIDSPYNTYKYTGLPPGPISNPGFDSIKAAIYPKFTDYNYFLTDPETGKTIFSKTLEEHNGNKVEYFK